MPKQNDQDRTRDAIDELSIVVTAILLDDPLAKQAAQAAVIDKWTTLAAHAYDDDFQEMAQNFALADGFRQGVQATVVVQLLDLVTHLGGRTKLDWWQSVLHEMRPNGTDSDTPS